MFSFELDTSHSPDVMLLAKGGDQAGDERTILVAEGTQYQMRQLQRLLTNILDVMIIT